MQGYRGQPYAVQQAIDAESTGQVGSRSAIALTCVYQGEEHEKTYNYTGNQRIGDGAIRCDGRRQL